MAQAHSGWIGFLVCAFAVVGLTGVFATYATPLPLIRAEQREAAFDAVLQATATPDRAAALEALRPALGEDADAVITASGGSPAGLLALRTAMRERFLKEADAVADRQRLLICVVTASGALFGVALLGLGRRN